MEPEIRLPTSVGSITEKAREFQNNIYSCFFNYVKEFSCVNNNKLWKILQEMRITDHLTCLLKNVYAGQEVTIRTGHGKMDWFKIGKGVHQGYMFVTLLIYMQSTSFKMLGWMTHKLESRLQEIYQQPQICR